MNEAPRPSIAWSLSAAVRSLRTLSATAAMLLVGAVTSQAQNTVLYDSTVLPANPQTNVVHYLQQLTLAQGNGTYTLNSFVLGINFNAGDSDQGVIVTFYTGLNLSPGAANALAGAVQVGQVNGTLGAPGSAGNFTYTFTLTSAISLPSNILGVEISLVNEAFDDYSTDMNGRFTASAPVTGTSPGFVWADVNRDGTFTGAEQTRFSMANANIRFSMTGSAPAVPEPSTWAMVAVGLVLLVVAQRRLA